ncbi:MAG: alpha/beta hydrolase [Rhodococcus sp. (in: high G+C Gram-positive bacteria)]|nr:MAG: alpha/beta hydrolase [Rhodococcus sp. (in: high G+C Gram-positive bacteria)]
MKVPLTSSHGIYRDTDASVRVRRWCREQLQHRDVTHSLTRLETPLGSTTVLSAGTRAGLPPVVLLPGTGLNAATTLPTVRLLHGKHRVFVPDIPGEPGLSSSHRPHRHRLRAYGAWLDNLLPQLSAEPVILVGHALGAAIALSATPSAGIAALVLVNPAGLVPLTPTRALTRLRTRSIRNSRGGTGERILTHLLSPRYLADENLTDWFSMLTRDCTPSRPPRRLPTDTVRRWAGQLPIIVATGEHDTLLEPERLRDPVRSLLDVELRTIARCGHLTLRERPHAVAELITQLP